MEKLNEQKESMIEIFRLIEKKRIEILSLDCGDNIIVDFRICFHIDQDFGKGDVYFEQIGRLKK